MSDLLVVLFTAAILLSLPAAVVSLGLAFHASRSRALLLRHGKLLVAAGVLAWGVSLVAHLVSGASGWGAVGSLLGLVVVLGVAMARSAAAQRGAAG